MHVLDEPTVVSIATESFVAHNPHVLVPRRLVNHHHHGMLGRVGRGSARLRLDHNVVATVLALRYIPLIPLDEHWSAATNRLPHVSESLVQLIG